MSNYTETELLEISRAFEKRVTARGFFNPELVFRIPGYSGAEVTVMAELYAAPHFNGHKTCYLHGTLADLPEKIGEVMAWLAGLDSNALEGRRTVAAE